MKISKENHWGNIPNSVLEKIRNSKIKKTVTGIVLGITVFFSPLGVVLSFSPIIEGNTLYNYVIEQTSRNYYQDVISDYENIIKKTVNSYKKLGITDPDTIFFLTTCLIHSGYFSENYFFEYNKVNNRNITNYEGIDIIKGSGDCNQEAEFLNRVLNEAGYLSKMVICYGHPKEEETNLFEEGNHIVVLLKKGDVYRIYDPTNFMVGQSNDGLNIKISNNNNIDLKLVESYAQGKSDFKTLYSFLKAANKENIVSDDGNILLSNENEVLTEMDQNRIAILPYINSISKKLGGKNEWNYSYK